MTTPEDRAKAKTPAFYRLAIMQTAFRPPIDPAHEVEWGRYIEKWIAHVQSEARDEALEEAAKEADEWATNPPTQGSGEYVARCIAIGIRELKGGAIK